MSLRFIHSADWHLFSPFSGIGSAFPELLPELLNAPQNAVKNMVNAALQHHVDFLLAAGDLFDGVPNYLQMSETLDLLAPLGAAGIPVYAVTGNHDLGSWQGIELPAWLHVFSPEAPEAKIFSKDGVPQAVICGISYSETNCYDNLAAQLAAVPTADNLFKIGLLHSNAGNVNCVEPYAPCDAATFRSSGMDYWALGHIHIPGAVEQTANVFYSGALQGRSIKEEGAHGCVLVAADGHQFTREEIHCDALRFRQMNCLVSPECGDLDALIHTLCDELGTAVSGTRRWVVRLNLTGETSLNHQLRYDYDAGTLRILLQKKLNQNGLSQMVIESISLSTKEPLNSELRSGLASEVAGELENLPGSPEFAQLVNIFGKRSDLQHRLINEFSPEELRGIADEAAELLIAELAAEGK